MTSAKFSVFLTSFTLVSSGVPQLPCLCTNTSNLLLPLCLLTNDTICEWSLSKLGRSEKMLGSIASGRWVMHPSYIVACKAAGRMVAEDDFEWGNPRNGFFDRLTSPTGVI